MISINREELAWAAGFFDGEGSTTCSGRKNHHRKYIRMGVSQVNPEPLERFNGAVGNIGSIHGPRIPRNVRSKPVWVWYSGDWRKCQAIWAMLWTFLGTQKRDQIKRCWATFTAQEHWGCEKGKSPLNKRDKTHCIRGHSLHDPKTVVTYLRYGWTYKRCTLCEKIRYQEKRGRSG